MIQIYRFSLPEQDNVHIDVAGKRKCLMLLRFALQSLKLQSPRIFWGVVCKYFQDIGPAQTSLLRVNIGQI